MRIWSKDLIKALPTKQLKAMRYELGDMIKQYPNIKHPLVKFANDYDMAYLGQYFKLVVLECNKRNINMNQKYNNEIITIILKNANISYDIGYDYFDNYYSSWDLLQFKEDNKRYLQQCYYNLQEKYDRGMITKDEWEKIENYFN